MLFSLLFFTNMVIVKCFSIPFSLPTRDSEIKYLSLGFMPESFAFADNQFYVGSLFKGIIAVVTRDGQHIPIIGPPTIEGSGPVQWGTL